MSISDPQRASRVIETRCRRIELASQFPAAILAFAYLASIFDPDATESLCLGSGLIGYAVVAGFLTSGRRRDPVLPFAAESAMEASAKSNADATNAYHSISSAPMAIQKTTFVVGLAMIAVLPPLMWMFGYEAWIRGDHFRSVALITLVGSLLGSALAFQWMKRSLQETRVAYADGIGRVAEGSLSNPRLSLRTKISFAVLFPTLAGLALVIDVVSLNQQKVAIEKATNWAGIALDVIGDADPELPLSVRIASRLPREDFWPVPLRIVEVRADRGEISASQKVSQSFVTAVAHAREQGRVAGPVVPVLGPEVGAYRDLGEDRVLIARVRRVDVESTIAGLDWLVGFVCLGILGLACLLARSVSRDVCTGLDALEEASRRLAAGDVVSGIGHASEDELGDLGSALGSLRALLYSTMSRLARTADAADRAVAGANAALAEVGATSVNQIELLQHVDQTMGMINARVDEASHSATNLTSTIDESGSSLLELGATGDELNQTATVLTSKVDAVSESLEQMVGSVKQIAGTTEKLSSASEETSSSMEEMASAMRAVDISAEATASLSREVVAKAELGQAKVVQTIAGMEAIREATDVAENVIRGLGDRTKEIGGILDVIDDVADETNLLALNAAIIAAQAGEHGKAFSVVADEIKELADRVLASTKEIGGLIRAVQDESENAIGAIEAGSASVMSGVDLSAEAGRTLEEITVASRESGTRIADIVTSVREQTNAASHVVQLMERVRESAEEIGVAGTEQDQGNEIVYESAQAMREVALQVRRTTEEQARGFGRIRKNVVGVRDAVEEITGSLGDQSGSCRQVSESLELVSRGNDSNEEAVTKMREAIRELASQAESLRADAERFRV